MNENYRNFFGLKREPFMSDISLGDILETQQLLAVKERFDYAVRLGAAALVTGDIGSGKSTALRYAIGKLHPSEYRSLYVTATSGSILELYRQILSELGTDTASSSRAVLKRGIRREIETLVIERRMKAVLIIDEASLLDLKVFEELHTLSQFEQDSKPYLPMVLAGQSNLVDKFMYRGAKPLASRVVGRSHLEGVDLGGMEDYLNHHIAIAGLKRKIFDPPAVTAIHQGAGGLFRKANHLARGALIAATANQSVAVTAEHVRLASSEIF